MMSASAQRAFPRRRRSVLIGVSCAVWLDGSVVRSGVAGASSPAEPTIAVELLQVGFAGQSGERTTVAADGAYAVQRVLNGQVRAKVREGRLTRAAMETLRAAIAAARLEDMPPRLGTPPAANPASLTVRAGAVIRTLPAQGGTGADGFAALARDAPGTPAARLVGLAARVFALTAP
jgi:hypothetical protein